MPDMIRKTFNFNDDIDLAYLSPYSLRKDINVVGKKFVDKVLDDISQHMNRSFTLLGLMVNYHSTDNRTIAVFCR